MIQIYFTFCGYPLHVLGLVHICDIEQLDCQSLKVVRIFSTFQKLRSVCRVKVNDSTQPMD